MGLVVRTTHTNARHMRARSSATALGARTRAEGVRPNPTTIVPRTTTSPRREATHSQACTRLTPSHNGSQHHCPGRNTPPWEVTSLIGHAAVRSGRARPHVAPRLARAGHRSRHTRGVGSTAPLAQVEGWEGGSSISEHRKEVGRWQEGRLAQHAVHRNGSGGRRAPSPLLPY